MKRNEADELVVREDVDASVSAFNFRTARDDAAAAGLEERERDRLVGVLPEAVAVAFFVDPVAADDADAAGPAAAAAAAVGFLLFAVGLRDLARLTLGDV